MVKFGCGVDRVHVDRHDHERGALRLLDQLRNALAVPHPELVLAVRERRLDGGVEG